MIDRCHLDEAGCALTLPTTYSWCPQGQRVRVPYQAPQGRRVNVIGAYFTPGPEAGRRDFQSWAVRPKNRAKKPRTTPQERAAANVELVYLARYCPEQSGIEPIWNDVKAHQIPQRSFAEVADLKHAVDDALTHKAQLLQHAHDKPTNLQRLAA